ncbi:hypothetical protein SBA4_3560006 [Candidatus Sulfopaludibacter sp. SbA4]|nr:hypothetical protein SBA4_3560006 [Candidatus Sulfopaludibacter sp. SbA4]
MEPVANIRIRRVPADSLTSPQTGTEYRPANGESTSYGPKTDTEYRFSPKRLLEPDRNYRFAFRIAPSRRPAPADPHNPRSTPPRCILHRGIPVTSFLSVPAYRLAMQICIAARWPGGIVPAGSGKRVAAKPGPRAVFIHILSTMQPKETTTQTKQMVSFGKKQFEPPRPRGSAPGICPPGTRPLGSEPRPPAPDTRPLLGPGPRPPGPPTV